jgi:hypothetical protein
VVCRETERVHILAASMPHSMMCTVFASDAVIQRAGGDGEAAAGAFKAPPGGETGRLAPTSTDPETVARRRTSGLPVRQMKSDLGQGCDHCARLVTSRPGGRGTRKSATGQTGKATRGNCAKADHRPASQSVPSVPPIGLTNGHSGISDRSSVPPKSSLARPAGRARILSPAPHKPTTPQQKKNARGFKK